MKFVGASTITRTWVVVATRTEARVLESIGPAHPLRRVHEAANPGGRLRNQDFDSDKHSSSFDRGGSSYARHATESEEAPHERVAANFARSIAETLRKGRTDGRFNHLVLVAEPRFLGTLKGALDGVTSDQVIGTLSKNLAAETDADIRAHLKDVSPV